MVHVFVVRFSDSKDLLVQGSQKQTSDSWMESMKLDWSNITSIDYVGMRESDKTRTSLDALEKEAERIATRRSRPLTT